MKFQNIKRIINNIDLKSVDPSTWVRTIMFLLALIGYLANAFGIMPPSVEENTVYNTVLIVFSIISFLQAFWKNNSFTAAAQESDYYLKLLKEDQKEEKNEKYQ